MAKVKILTRKELCELTGIKTATMRVYIKRGHLVESSENELNVFNNKNQTWLVDYCSKKDIDYGPIFKSTKNDIPKKKPTVQSLLVDEILEEEKKDYVPDDVKERAKLNNEKLIQKKEKEFYETELKKIELEKKKAKVVPVDFIIEMFSGYIKTNIVGINNEVDKMISELIDEFGGDYETKLKYKKRLRELINNTFKNNHDAVSKDIIEKAKDYSLNVKW